MVRQVILASQSKQRRDLLASLGCEFSVRPADIDELRIQDSDHAVRAAKVALAKAEKVSALEPEAIVIAADTFVVLDEERLEKPVDKEEAREMLTKMSGRTMTVYTGWAFFDPSKSVKINQTSVAEITFRSLSPTEIERYVTTYPVTNWAASFTASHMPGLSMIADVHGSLTCVLGLPLEDLVVPLSNSGVIV